MTKGIFVTATGTDVGKTFVSGLLTKKMRECGFNCGYYKPVLSGLEEVNGELIPGDCKHVLDTARLDVAPLSCVSYAFKPAVSPHLAAQIEGKTITLEQIKKDFQNIAKGYDYLVIEGAGGLICPLKMDEPRIILTDLIKFLGLDVIVVAPSGLGAINYAVLTVEYAKANNINVKGIILNNFEKDNFMHIDNKKCIEELTKVPVIATVAHGDRELDIKKDDMLKNFKEI